MKTKKKYPVCATVLWFLLLIVWTAACSSDDADGASDFVGSDGADTGNGSEYQYSDGDSDGDTDGDADGDASWIGGSNDTASGGYAGEWMTDMDLGDIVLDTDDGTTSADMAWFQLSPDDSTSMATAQLLKQFNLYGAYGFSLHSHEVINYYDPPFSYRTEGDFAHHWNTEEDIHVALDGERLPDDRMELLVHVFAPQVPLAERRPWNLHLCVDVSGSMAGERLNFTKDALRRLINALRDGDRLSIVTFESNAQRVLQSTDWSAGMAAMLSAVNGLSAGGGTNMKAGLDLAYAQAQAHYDAHAINRVLLFSDGDANVGVTDYERISELTRMNNQEGIYLSGVGVGTGYAMGRMDALTDAGKGAHVFLPDANEVEIVFGPMLRKLIEVAADEVSIEVELPVGFTLGRFSGEESSTNPQERVQNVVLAAGDDMTLLATFEADDPDLFGNNMIFTFRYTPLSTGQDTVFTRTISIESLLREPPGLLMERTRLVNDYALFAILAAQAEVDGAELLDRVQAFQPQDNGLIEIAAQIERRLGL